MTQLPSSAPRESRELGPKWLRSTVFPLFLLCCCPPFVMLLWYTHTQLDGSLLKLLRVLWNEGLWSTLGQIWTPRLLGSLTAWKILSGTTGWALMRPWPTTVQRNGCSRWLRLHMSWHATTVCWG